MIIRFNWKAIRLEPCFTKFGFVLLTSIVSLVPYTCPNAFADSNNNTKNAELVWVHKNAQNFDIAYSYFNGKSWSEKVLFTTGNPVNFVPDLAKDRTEKTHLVWAADTSKKYRLYYLEIDADNKANGPYELATELQSNTTPTIVTTPRFVTWVCWSGNDGNDDDIYCFYKKDEIWSLPEKVHPENSYPDILPELSINNNLEVQLTWLQITKDGNRTIQLNLSKHDRTPISSVARSFSYQKALKDIKNCVPHLPNDIDESTHVSLLTNCELSTKKYKDVKIFNSTFK